MVLFYLIQYKFVFKFVDMYMEKFGINFILKRYQIKFYKVIWNVLFCICIINLDLNYS